MAKYQPRRLTREEDMWEEGQALKVLAYADLIHTDIKAFVEAVKYQPFPKVLEKKASK